MVFRPFGRARSSQKNEQGYILLALLLIVALAIIAAAIILPSITYQIRRDREEELIHRGVQYSRAIRAYYKKFGRYPTKIEDLESSNNVRFLRKRYKDPMTGKDFRLLHYGEVKLSLSGGIGGGTIPGASPIGAPNGTSGLGQTSSFGGTAGGVSSFGGNSFGGNSGPGTMNSPGLNPQSSNGEGNTNQSGTNATDSSTSSGGPGSSNSDSGNGSGPVLGGGPIVGVVSGAKCPPRPKDECEGYREFNHKNKYSDWQFVYDPGTDRGGLIMTPYQPSLMMGGMQGMMGGTTGMPGTTGNGFSPIGGQGGMQNNGMQNNPMSPPNGSQNPPPAPTGPGSSPQ